MDTVNDEYQLKYKTFKVFLETEHKKELDVVDNDTYKNAQIFLALLPKRAVLRLEEIYTYRSGLYFYWVHFSGCSFNIGILKNNKIDYEGYSLSSSMEWVRAIVPFDRNEIPKTFLFKLNLLRK